mmetsp:Transcript_2374/g.3602  ORF Transcript_2374/g.3602 Transcript_2374/m.3602 type:complete len:100 (+) Transcript_2374:202-501(+)
MTQGEQRKINLKQPSTSKSGQNPNLNLNQINQRLPESTKNLQHQRIEFQPVKDQADKQKATKTGTSYRTQNQHTPLAGNNAPRQSQTANGGGRQHSDFI